MKLASLLLAGLACTEATDPPNGGMMMMTRRPVCTDLTSCGECTSGGTCKWQSGRCDDSCMIMGLPCYDGGRAACPAGGGGGGGSGGSGISPRPGEGGTGILRPTMDSCATRKTCASCTQMGCKWQGVCYPTCMIMDSSCWDGTRAVCPADGGSGPVVKPPMHTCANYHACGPCTKNGCKWTQGACGDTCRKFDTCYDGTTGHLCPAPGGGGGGGVITGGPGSHPCNFYHACGPCVNNGCKFQNGQCNPNCPIMGSLPCYDKGAHCPAPTGGGGGGGVVTGGPGSHPCNFFQNCAPCLAGGCKFQNGQCNANCPIMGSLPCYSGAASSCPATGGGGGVVAPPASHPCNFYKNCAPCVSGGCKFQNGHCGRNCPIMGAMPCYDASVGAHCPASG